MRFNSKYWTNQETELFVSEWNKHYQWAQKEREYYRYLFLIFLNI